jgi:hypothetical protein
MLVAAAVATGAVSCSASHVTPAMQPRPPAAARDSSLVRVPAPDYASPESVAAAFYTAWGGTDAIHDSPAAPAARCTALATPALNRQLPAGQPAPAAWAAMQRERYVSLVRVIAVTQPSGAPSPTSSVVWLRVYAQRTTTTTSLHAITSDGITLKLTRAAGRWLVAAVVFWD